MADRYAELERVVNLYTKASIDSLQNPIWLAKTTATVGLFNDGRAIYGEYNRHQAPFQSPALWQHPDEFAQYLILLGKSGIRRYLDLGCFHGFGAVLTAAYLKRFDPTATVTAADLNPWIPRPLPPVFDLIDYRQPSTSKDYDPGNFDCVLIDADHDYTACKEDYGWLGECKMVAFHDINDQDVRDRCQGGGVWTLWQELKQQHFNTTEILRGDGQQHMGIGIIHN